MNDILNENQSVGVDDIEISGRLDHRARMVAMMDASGLKPQEIADQIGISKSYVYGMRMNEDYREAVGDYHQLIARKYVEGATDIVGMFNEQIGPSVATMIEVRDNRNNKPGDRLKASKEFLDRAPEAPKARRDREAESLVISIPVSTMEGMKRALLEEGTREDREILELVEGEGWKEEEKEKVITREVDEIIKVRQM